MSATHTPNYGEIAMTSDMRAYHAEQEAGRLARENEHLRAVNAALRAAFDAFYDRLEPYVTPEVLTALRKLGEEANRASR